MKRLSIILLLFASVCCRAQSLKGNGPEYHGLKLAADELGKMYVVNKHNVIILPVDSTTIETNEVIQQIKNSTLKDKLLIARVLELYPDAARRLEEIKNLSAIYNEVALIVLNQAEMKLKSSFSNNQLEELKNKKK